MTLSEADFLNIVRGNPGNKMLLDLLPELNLPGCMITAGCLFQTVWNARSGHAPGWGIKDYDIFYFDPGDLSWEAEDRVIRRCAELVAPYGVTAEVRNQARVHLWYEKKFGIAYPPLSSCEEGVDRYLVRCTMVGVRVADGSVYAPEGLDEMWDGILTPNPRNAQPELFLKKAEQYRARWPWLEMRM